MTMVFRGASIPLGRKLRLVPDSSGSDLTLGVCLERQPEAE